MEDSIRFRLRPDGTMDEVIEDTCGYLDSLLAGNWVLACCQDYPMDEMDRDEAVDKALTRKGDEAYSLLNNNCEHFVNQILTGMAWSGQVAAGVTVGIGIIAGVAVVGSGGLIGAIIGGGRRDRRDRRILD